jgi:hypothetical protein
VNPETLVGEVARMTCGCVWTRTSRNLGAFALHSVELVWSPCPTHLPGYVAASQLSPKLLSGLLGPTFPPTLRWLNEAADKMIRFAAGSSAMIGADAPRL